MLPHVWVKIIPSSLSDVENFAFSIGQRWDLIQHLMIELNYLYKYKDTVRIRLDKLKDLEQQCVEGIDLHIGSSHPKGEKLTYYICRDTPIFKHPLLQVKKNFKFADLQFKNSYDTQLRQSITNYCVNKNKVKLSIPIVHRARVITSVNSPSTNDSTEIVTPPPAPPINYIEEQIDAALSLDLDLFPRPHRKNETFIPPNNCKQATQQEKLLLLLNAAKWGYNTYNLSYAERTRILRASSRLVAYDNGYKKEFSITSIKLWEKLSTDGVELGIESAKIVRKESKGSLKKQT